MTTPEQIEAIIHKYATGHAGRPVTTEQRIRMAVDEVVSLIRKDVEEAFKDVLTEGSQLAVIQSAPSEQTHQRYEVVFSLTSTNLEVDTLRLIVRAINPDQIRVWLTEAYKPRAYAFRLLPDPDGKVLLDLTVEDEPTSDVKPTLVAVSERDINEPQPK